MTYEKIIKELHPEVLKTINELIESNRKDKLVEWLDACIKEIETRNEYKLHCEKEYLIMAIGGLNL